MKLVKTIANKYEYGTYASLLRANNVSFESIQTANMDILTYTSRDGRNLRAEVTSSQYDCDGWTETVNIYQL